MQLNRETLDALNSSLERQHSLNQNVNRNTFSLQGLMSMYIWYNVYSLYRLPRMSLPTSALLPPTPLVRSMMVVVTFPSLITLVDILHLCFTRSHNYNLFGFTFLL